MWREARYTACQLFFEMSMMEPGWQLYLIQTAAGMLYTGITTDVNRRLQQHERGRGARSLRGKGPLTLVFHCNAGDRAAASRLEYQVKQLGRAQKLLLVAQQPPCLITWFSRND
jgi:putative endonuclease